MKRRSTKKSLERARLILLNVRPAEEPLLGEIEAADLTHDLVRSRSRLKFWIDKLENLAAGVSVEAGGGA